MAQMGEKQIEVMLTDPIADIPDSLSAHNLTLNGNGRALVYTYDTNADRTGITTLLNDVAQAGLVLSDVQTRQSSLEEIFVNLVSGEAV
jgi:ABC-2 type transport system ATP-binding protein